MAYAALVSLAHTIDQILNHDQVSISLPEKQNIISLYEQTVFLQAFLEEFPENVESLEGRTRDVANEAEDIIEFFMWKQIHPGHMLIKWTVRPAKFNEQLEEVIEKIESISGEAMEIKNSFRMKDVRHSHFSAASSSPRLAAKIKNDMVGFGDELIEIKTRLCGESSRLLIIPIVGMAGIGKTTLAKNIYDDPLIVEYFHVCAWVTVSQDCSAQEILSSLFQELNMEMYGESNELTEEHVYKSLKGRRYLIVMDDMWSTIVWDDLKIIFPDDHNGSRIMLTTRLLDVATYANSFGPIYEMRFMNEDQSWNLLRQKVFMHQNCPPELEKIGQEIARSCRGLPLAIVVIAGLLSTVGIAQASWEEVAKNVNSAVATKDGQFEKIFSLSYNHLPHHLRPCFLYMGGFPQDHEIKASKLIKLWIAEGFIKPNVSTSHEEAAEEHLTDLVKRSLVLVTKRKSNGKIKSCSVHDLVWNLCIRKAHQEEFLMQVTDKHINEFRFLPAKKIEDHRRIAHSDFGSLAKVDGSTIRTLICFQRGGNSYKVDLRDFRLLRVLHVANANVWLHTLQVFKLSHLRYLVLGYHMIPATILNLRNLQTLIVHRKRTFGSYISPKIWRLPQLSHLVSPSFGQLPKPKRGNPTLENLRTLSLVTNFVFTERVLKMIPNLKKLGVSYTRKEHIQHLHNLVHLHQLENLKLKVTPGFPSSRKVDIVFPKMLKKLTLSGWRIPWKDMRIVGSLPNLQVLKLRDSACYGRKWETAEGEFSQLKFLLIDTSRLQHWIIESSHFPSLKCLLLHRCRYLGKIPKGIGEIPTLELIEIKLCSRSLVNSAKRIQEEQQNCGIEALQVRCMHSDGALRSMFRTVVNSVRIQ